MRLYRLDQLPAHRVQRVERGQRVLKNRTNPPTPNVPHLLVRQVVDAFAFEQDLTAADAPRRFQQPDDGGAGQRLAGARLADNTKDFTRSDVK